MKLNGHGLWRFIAGMTDRFALQEHARLVTGADPRRISALSGALTRL